MSGVYLVHYIIDYFINIYITSINSIYFKHSKVSKYPNWIVYLMYIETKIWYYKWDSENELSN